MFDAHIDMEISLPSGEGREIHHKRVKRRAVEYDGNPLGTETNNPITDTQLYEVEYLDGSIETHAANAISDSVISQVED